MNRSIVMTVCQRPFYLEPVLEGWSEVRGVKDWPFIFMVEPTPTKLAMLKLIENFDHPDKTVIENTTRLGVLNNPYAGLNNAFAHGADFVILAEEDLLPSTNILEYFDYGNSIAKNSSNVLAVCAQGEGFEPNKVEFKANFKVWLWGTWKDRWTNVLRDTWDHDYSTGEFPPFASGWDWNIDLRIIPQGNYTCLYPKASLVDNLGQWAGAHAVPEDYEKYRPIGFVQELDPAPFELSE